MIIADLRCHAWAVAAAILAGCTAAPSPNAVQALPPPAAGRPAHTLARYVFVAECCRFNESGGNITLYEPALAGVARTITDGVGEADFITVDGSGRLYAVNRFYGGTVTEYDRGSLTPTRHFRSKGAWAAATDDSNNLYVASCPTCLPYGSGRGTVVVYKAGTTKVLRTIADGVDVPLSLAFDTSGNLYVANSVYPRPDVSVYSPGSSRPLRELRRGLNSPLAIALDPSNDLFVLNNPSSTSKSVVEYQAGSDKILRRITSGLLNSQALALDASGTLYVSNVDNTGHGWVSVYKTGTSAPSYTITEGVDGAGALMADAEDNLYVANAGYYVPPRNRGTTCVYAVDTQKPLRCVRSQRKFDFPTWLASGP